MAFTLTTDDHELLLALARRGVMTATQAAIICARNGPGIRRRVQALREHGLVDTRPHRLARGSGRPTNLLCLLPDGVAYLKSLGLIDAEIPTDRLLAPVMRHPEHEEVISEVWAQLTLLTRHLEGFAVRDLAPALLPANHSGSTEGPGAHAHLDAGADGLIPDGIFSIHHQGVGKTLLFFLEVDMGTQPRTSSRGPNRDVQSKILRYQAWFRSGAYQRFSTGDPPFKGFRVLFVAGRSARIGGLCRVINRTPPSDFVWATDDDRLRQEGLWARIWTAGGDLSQGTHSILGSLAPVSGPAPASLVTGRPDAEVSTQAKLPTRDDVGRARGRRQRRKA